MFLTNASVAQPVQPFDDDAERRLIEHGGIKDAKPQGELQPPPQQTARAVRVHVVLTLLLFARATASRLRGEARATGTEPVGWQRWRRQLLPQHRDTLLVVAPGSYGIVHVAESSSWLGGKLNDGPPGIGTRQDVLAPYQLTGQS